MLLEIRTSSNNLNKPDLFFYFSQKVSYKIKANGQHLSFNIYICRPRPRHTIKTNFIKFKGVYPEIYAILICYKRVWD